MDGRIGVADAQIINLPTRRCSTTIEVALVTAICLTFVFLVISFARHSSATFDETVRLPAGLSYLRWHDYRLNIDHPPLLKKLAALPLLSVKVWPVDVGTNETDSIAKADWRKLPDSRSVLDRAWAAATVDYFEQWIFGHSFLYGLRDETIARLHQLDPSVIGPYTVPASEQLSKADFYNDPDALLFRARMVVMVLGVLLALCVYTWSRALFGIPGGMLSILLLCFDPNIIAHSGLVTTDIAVTLFISGALYFLWRVCRRIEIVSVVLFLLFFAAAFVTKFSAAILIVTFWLAVSARVISPDPWPVSGGIKISLDSFFRRLVVVTILFLVAMLAAFAAIWASYDFRYAAAKTVSGVATFPIEQAVYRHAAIKMERKRWPTGVPREERSNFEARVADAAQKRPLTLKGSIIVFVAQHRLLPEAYLYGLAHSSLDPLMRTSFLRGRHSSSGFRSSYLWAFLLKTPLPAMFAILAAIVGLLSQRIAKTWQLGFIASAVATCCLSVSMFAPINIAERYLLPAYPFLYLFCGALGVEWSRFSALPRRVIATVAVLTIAASSQFVFYPIWRPEKIHPHYLAYFNEIAGGPRNGYNNLVDSNLDWGQELKHLKRWLDDRNITEPIWLSYFGTADARWHQIRHISVPKVLGGSPFEASPYSAFEDSGAPDKAVGAFLNDLRPGQYLVVSATNLAAVYLGAQTRDVWQNILAQCTYIDQVGYSLFIYQIGRDE